MTRWVPLWPYFMPAGVCIGFGATSRMWWLFAFGMAVMLFLSGYEVNRLRPRWYVQARQRRANYWWLQAGRADRRRRRDLQLAAAGVRLQQRGYKLGNLPVVYSVQVIVDDSVKRAVEEENDYYEYAHRARRWEVR